MKSSFFRKAFSEDGKKRYGYILFTILLCMSLCCFSWIIFSGRSFIWSGEGWSKHYRALVYYSDYLKEIFRHLFADHALIIPEWDFYIGEGGDIMGSLLSGTAGDPVAFLSVFVPASAMPGFYAFSIVLRMYLAGLAFMALCFGTGQKNRCAILAGAIGYSFCGWGLYYAVRIPCYLNPLIWLPLIILGIEKIIRGKKPYLLIFATAFSAAGSLWSLRTTAVVTLIYVAIRLFFIFRAQAEEAAKDLLCILLASALGILLAGIMLLPASAAAAGESGIGTFSLFGLLYPAFFYNALPGAVFSNSTGYVFGYIIGLTAPAFLAVVLVFAGKKEDLFLKVLTAIGLAGVLIPAVGVCFGGDSSVTGSWSFALALLCMYILVKKWDVLANLPQKQWKVLTAVSVIYFVLCVCCCFSRIGSACAAIPVIFLTLLVIRENSEDGKGAAPKQAFLLGVVVFQVICSAFWMYAPGAGNFVSYLMENDRLAASWENNEAAALKSVTKDQEEQGYVRITGRGLTENAGVSEQISAADHDDRTTPSALAGAQYYTAVNGDTAGMPYGYTLVDTVNGNPTQEEELKKLEKEFEGQEVTDAQKGKITGKTSTKYSVFKNDHALNIGYCYDSYFTKETLESLNAVQKQEAYLKAACVDETPGEIAGADLQMPEYLADYDLECTGGEISEGHNCIITTADNTSAVITLKEEIPKAEFYVEFTGLTFTPTREYDLYFGGQSVDPLNLYNRTNWDLLLTSTRDEVRKDRKLFDPNQDVNITVEPSAGRKKDIVFRFDEPGRDRIVNLGYTESAALTFRLTFPKRGVYSYDSLNVYAVPVEGFDAGIENLQKNMLEDVTVGTDTLTGSLSLDEPKLLCLAVPYSKGWKAYIDGKKTKNLCVNESYQGIVVPAGEHTIEYRYHTPRKSAGALLTLLGLAGTAAWIIYDVRKKKKASAPAEMTAAADPVSEEAEP